jgi:hypothetical protein
VSAATEHLSLVQAVYCIRACAAGPIGELNIFMCGLLLFALLVGIFISFQLASARSDGAGWDNRL